MAKRETSPKPKLEASTKPKLSVYTDRALMRRIRKEKADTERTIEDLVNTRLLLSYESHPSPLRVAQPASA